MEMLVSLSLKRATIVLSIAVLFFDPATAQPTLDGTQTAILVEILSRIKTAVQDGHYPSQPNPYKVISLRLGQCAVIFRMSSEIDNSESPLRTQYRDASNVFFRAGSAIYPGNEETLINDLKNWQESALKLRSDKKAMFYFLRNCRDFLKPNTVASAVSELLL
jgi:hypothetical protein